MAEDLIIKKYVIDGADAVMITPAEVNDKLTLNEDMSHEVNSGFSYHADFILYNNEKDVCLTSESRDITIMFNDMVLLRERDEEEATQNFNYVIELLNNADSKFEESGFPDEARGKLYFNIVRDLYENKISAEEHLEFIQTKQESKRVAKESVKDKWFKIGQYYSLKKFDRTGHVKETTLFKCVKFIYTVGVNQVNHVVMQKIGETHSGNARTLSPMDCKMWHIKYSPDLYMFPMSQRFYPVTEKDLKSIESVPIEKEIEQFKIEKEIPKKTEQLSPNNVHNIVIRSTGSEIVDLAWKKVHGKPPELIIGNLE